MQLGLDVLGLSCHLWCAKLNFAHTCNLRLNAFYAACQYAVSNCMYFLSDIILTVLNLTLHTPAI